jgi:hypothetical protein
MKLSVHFVERFVHALTTDNSTGIRQKWKQSVPRYSTTLCRRKSTEKIFCSGFNVEFASTPARVHTSCGLTCRLSQSDWKDQFGCFQWTFALIIGLLALVLVSEQYCDCASNDGLDAFITCKKKIYVGHVWVKQLKWFDDRIWTGLLCCHDK